MYVSRVKNDGFNGRVSLCFVSFFSSLCACVLFDVCAGFVLFYGDRVMFAPAFACIGLMWFVCISMCFGGA